METNQKVINAMVYVMGFAANEAAKVNAAAYSRPFAKGFVAERKQIGELTSDLILMATRYEIDHLLIEASEEEIAHAVLSADGCDIGEYLATLNVFENSFIAAMSEMDSRRAADALQWLTYAHEKLTGLGRMVMVG